MAIQPKTSFLRGRRARATLLTAAGVPVIGPESQAVTRGFISVSYTSSIEEGEGISVTNAGGENCVSEAAVPSLTGFGVEVEFCNADFSMFSLVTGQDVVLNDRDEIIGITESTDVDITTLAFGLELWLGAQTDAAAPVGAQGNYGYVLTPFLSPGVISDLSVQNGAITFTITGMATKSGNNWGAGPYNVELVGGVAAPLFDPLGPNDHRRIMRTEIAPPEETNGLKPLLDLSADALTSIDAVVTGSDVEFTPVPAGTDPYWIDFGNGQWDYVESGGVYNLLSVAPGSYTATAYRGGSRVTEPYTVV